MISDPSEHDLAIWRRYATAVSAYNQAARELQAAREALFGGGVDRAALFRLALSNEWRYEAFSLLERLSEAELQALFPELVYWVSSAHGAILAIRKAILSLPKEWLLERIEAAAEPYLRVGTDDEYRRFLELYSDLDRDLTHRLAQRAIIHSNPEVREAGEEFLSWLGGNEP